MPICARRLIIPLLILTIIACGRRAERQSSKLTIKPVATNPRKDSLVAVNRASHVDAGSTAQDDTVPTIDLEPRLRRITKADYEEYKKSYRTACSLDSNGFIKGSGLSLENSCDEICQSALKDRKSGKEIPLMADFDEGILGLRVSPSCKRFITYSSYDGPGYDQYYAYRALIVSYKIIGIKKPLIVKPTFIYTMWQWSIEAVTWINDKSVVLKVYHEQLSVNPSSVHYEYYKAVL